jgi:uncharacterized protein YcnI
VNSSRRAALTGASAVAFLLVGSGPASAHVEVSAEGSAQAGTGPVTLQFLAESESTSAGITGVRTRLPEGIEPEDVALADGPEGWDLTPTAEGFELGGPEVPAGEDAEYSVTVELLPADATELAFPTIQVYSDGTEDAWIEPITDDVPDPEKPAPVLTVAPAPAETTTAAPSSAAADTSTPSPTASTDPQVDAAPDSDDDSNGGTIALVAGAVIVAALAAGAWFWRARRRP